ncbi:MAG TPA: hypothetical protein VFB72_02325, partial [Verrucomicrobiae bacterium]|nr:hypothetical protein [Verrucomicrobiae bacterium]
GAAIYLVATPKSYRATAEIKLEKRDWVHGQNRQDAQNPYDPNLAPLECQVLRSNIFFDRVAQNLGLAQTWGKIYHQGTPLTVNETRARLRSKADIKPIRDSTVIQIIVTSEDRDETARIANEFARLYMEYRQAQRQDLIHGKVDSLQHQWDVQNKKIEDAEARLRQIKLEIRRNRTNDGPVFYDQANYDALQAKRIDMETQIVQLRDQLQELKSLSASELPQVLSSLETNSALNASLVQLRKARNDLSVAESDHGPDTTEYKHARQLVDQLDKRITQQAGAILALKQADLSSREAALKALTEQLANVKSADQPDTNLFQNPDFAKTYDEWRQAQRARDALQDKMKDTDTAEAIKPVVITADLVNQADVPSRPYMPDGHIAFRTMGGGGALSVAGLGLFFLLNQRAKRAARKN